MAQPKVSKESVSYSNGHPGSRCGVCVFFIRYEALCKKVRGPIAGSKWCELFEKKPGSGK